MNDDLERCPFCEGEAAVFHDYMGWKYIAKCLECSEYLGGQTLGGVKARWNSAVRGIRKVRNELTGTIGESNMAIKSLFIIIAEEIKLDKLCGWLTKFIRRA